MRARGLEPEGSDENQNTFFFWPKNICLDYTAIPFITVHGPY